MTTTGESVATRATELAGCAYAVRWYENAVDLAERRLVGARENLAAARRHLHALTDNDGLRDGEEQP